MVKHEVPEEIPFEVKEDPTLPVGKIVVDQQGEKGSKTTRYTQNIKNGEPDGEMKSKEIAKKEPKKHIVKVGKKPATNDLKVNKEVGVDIEYVYDPNMDVTTAKKSDFTPGTVKTVVENKYNPETGKIESTEKTVVTPAKQKIIVGVKKFTGDLKNDVKKEIPYEAEIVFDDTMEAGTKKVEQEGKPGSVTTTYTQHFDNGKQTSVTKEDKETVQSTKRIIKVGSKTEGEHFYIEKIPFKYTVEVDPEMEADKYEITKTGTAGERKTTWKIKNSKIDGEPTVYEAPAVDAVIKVGNKDSFTTTDKNPIPFEVEYKIDPSLKPGEQVVDQEGQLGEEETKTTHTIKNGQVTESKDGEKTQTKAPVKKIVRIGAKTDGTYNHKDPVPFDVEVRVNKDLKKGEYKVVQKGEPDEKETTVIVENSQVKGDPTVKTIKGPKKQIIEVGDKDFEGEVSYEMEQPIPYEIEIQEDPELDLFEIKEVQLGSVKTCHTQKLKNGEAVGDLIDEVLKRKEPQKRIIKIGTKPVTNTETKDKEVLVEVTYKYDDTKDKGTVEKGQYTPGKVETKVVSKVVDGKVANTEETVVTPAKQIIKVGTKITEDTCKLPNAVKNPTGTPGEPETPETPDQPDEVTTNYLENLN